MTLLGRSRAAGEDVRRAERTAGAVVAWMVDRAVQLPWRIEMKETGRIKPGVEGRDERDADNTSCNIDEETEGKGRAVFEAAQAASLVLQVICVARDARVQMLPCNIRLSLRNNN